MNIEKVLIILTIAIFIAFIIVIFFVFRETYKNEKKRKKFANTIKVGDKCKRHVNAVVEGEIINIEGDVITIAVKCHRCAVYPIEEK
jgi:preprotein translocase subunit YajC